MESESEIGLVSVQKIFKLIYQEFQKFKGKIFRKADLKPFEFLQHFHLIINSKTFLR
jgi:hypothetical protein